MSTGTPLVFHRLRLLIGTAPEPVEPDVDDLDFADPHSSPEELLIAAETLAGRGYWAMGTRRPPAEKLFVTKKWRPADARLPARCPSREQPWAAPALGAGRDDLLPLQQHVDLGGAREGAPKDR